MTLHYISPRQQLVMTNNYKINDITLHIWPWHPQTVNDYRTDLQEDLIVKVHLISLYDHLLEQNLVKIIEPYTTVQVEHVAKLINMPLVSGGGGLQWQWGVYSGGGGQWFYSMGGGFILLQVEYMAKLINMPCLLRVEGLQ